MVAAEFTGASLVDAPFAMALKAAVAVFSNFHTDCFTIWTNTARVQPVAVTIQRILDDVVVHLQR